jgi:sugar phosphate permease
MPNRKNVAIPGVRKAPTGATDPFEAATIRRVSLRLLPFLMLAYLVCYIDRVNAGFAALQMNKDIGLTGTVFGVGGGIFFVGYFLFEVPSNLALERFGASKWICRIMLTWGIVGHRHSGSKRDITGERRSIPFRVATI